MVKIKYRVIYLIFGLNICTKKPLKLFVHWPINNTFASFVLDFSPFIDFEFFKLQLLNKKHDMFTLFLKYKTHKDYNKISNTVLVWTDFLDHRSVFYHTWKYSRLLLKHSVGLYDIRFACKEQKSIILLIH